MTITTVQIIHKESRLSHTDPIFKKSNLQLLKCYFKYEYNSLPKYFDVFNLRLNSEIHAHNTRNQHKLERIVRELTRKQPSVIASRPF